MPNMPRKLPPFVYRERTRHGRYVYYFRRGKGLRIRLPDLGLPDFNRAYLAALQSGKPLEGRVTEQAGTLAWLAGRYKQSAHFASLKPSTRRMRDNILKSVIATSGHVPFNQITRRHINEAIDRRTAAAGSNFRKVMSQMFKWAVSVELLTVNPCDGANRVRIETDGFHVWTIAEVEKFRERWPVGTRERLALDLMLFTGLRRSDIFRLGRQHVSDGLISIRTEKTGKSVHVPIFPELKASIDASPTGDLAFVVTATGKPFASAASFGNWFGKACVAAGVPGRAHGLRKAGATIAADHGATAHELMAMFGWKRLAQAETYTRQADEKRLAGMASERIANAMRPHLPPGAGNRAKT
jgi:integrase